MKRRQGRPNKYALVLESLDPQKLYCPSLISDHAIAHCIPPFEKDMPVEDLLLLRQRIRITLGRLAHNAGFPESGDGIVSVKGQSGIRAYWGERWQNAYKKPHGERNENESVMHSSKEKTSSKDSFTPVNLL